MRFSTMAPLVRHPGWRRMLLDEGEESLFAGQRAVNGMGNKWEMVTYAGPVCLGATGMKVVRDCLRVVNPCDCYSGAGQQ